MTYLTDERLKSYLDANQLGREQMCRAVLALDKRFSNVTPRHPRGGPDGGRDIQAYFKGGQLAFGAVGFRNQADDSKDSKRKVKAKFEEDLSAALKAESDLKVFVFFTNVNLTATEKDDLVAHAKEAGIGFCEIFDRERIRIQLDDADGLAARFQHLGIPLSDAEQASFFAKWGDDIQSMVATGFQRLERSLERILFLQETFDVLEGITLKFELDREYSANEIGHFRAFCFMHLKEPKLKIFGILFGSSDKSMRMRSDPVEGRVELPGIKHGISGGQWEEHLDLEKEDPPDMLGDDDTPSRYRPVGSSSSVGMDPVRAIFIRYSHDPALWRFQPRISLRDIDQASFLPLLNKSLAEKVKTISVYANGYLLQQTTKPQFSIDPEPFDADVPAQFSTEELADPWVRVRPERASAFSISFAEETPQRLFTSKHIIDTATNS